MPNDNALSSFVLLILLTLSERFDQDNSGTIDFDEYLVLIQHWIEQDEEQIYEAFKVSAPF